MRRSLLATAALTAALLSACTSTETSPDASPTATEPGPQASADVEPATPVPTASTAGEEAGGAGGATAGVDQYCDPAQAGIVATLALWDAADRKSEQTGIEDDGGDVSVMNAAGEEMLAHAAEAQTAWAQALDHLDDPAWDPDAAPITASEMADAIIAYDQATTAWTLREAEIAATATSIADYDLATVALLADESVLDAAADAGEALNTMLDYTLERCGEIEGLS